MQSVDALCQKCTMLDVSTMCILTAAVNALEVCPVIQADIGDLHSSLKRYCSGAVSLHRHAVLDSCMKATESGDGHA